MGALFAFLMPFLKDKGIMLVTDKGIWVTVVALAFNLTNKYAKLGLEDSVVNTLAVAIAGWLVVHFAHQNTVNKG